MPGAGRLRDLLLQSRVPSGPERDRPAPHRPRRGLGQGRPPRGVGGGRRAASRRRRGPAARAPSRETRREEWRADPESAGHRAPTETVLGARRELPELLRLRLPGRALGPAARRGRRPHRSTDHRARRARARPPLGRAVRLPLPGRLPRGGAAPRRFPKRARRAAARAHHPLPRGPRGSRGGGGRDDAGPARGRKGGRPRPGRRHSQLGGLLRDRSRSQAESVVDRPGPRRAVRRHALGECRALPEPRGADRRRRAALRAIPTSWWPSSAMA